MSDLRRAVRTRAFVPGAIQIKLDCSPLYCTVRDLSEAGARLAFGQFTKLPTRFRLIVPSRKLLCEVELRWQRGREIGVSFTSVETNSARARFDEPKRASASSFI